MNFFSNQKKKAPQIHLIAQNIETLYGMIWSLSPAPIYPCSKVPSSKNERTFYADNRIQ